MRIAFMFYDGGHYKGGPLTNAINLLPKFVQHGHDVLGIVLRFNKESISNEQLLNAGVKLVFIDLPGDRSLIGKRIIKYLNKYKPDIFVPNICLSGLLIAKSVEMAGIPSIAAHRSNDSRNWLIAKTFAVNQNYRLSALVCVSRFLSDKTKELTSDSLKISVIPSGVPLANRIVRNNQFELKFIYSGRLVQEQKRIYDVLNVFFQICEKYNNAHCTFVGTGIEEKNIRDRIEKKEYSERIKVFGHLEGDEYHQELKKHKFIVLLSDYEGTPGAVMDGMAHGLVPIISKFDGATELVDHGKNGFLVNNISDVLNHLENLINQPKDFKILSRAAYLKIKKSYSIEATTAKWLSLFEELLYQRPQFFNKIEYSKSEVPSWDSKLQGYEFVYPYFWFRWTPLRKIYRIASLIKVKLFHRK